SLKPPRPPAPSTKAPPSSRPRPKKTSHLDRSATAGARSGEICPPPSRSSGSEKKLLPALRLLCPGMELDRRLPRKLQPALRRVVIRHELVISEIGGLRIGDGLVAEIQRRHRFVAVLLRPAAVLVLSHKMKILARDDVHRDQVIAGLLLRLLAGRDKPVGLD